MYFLRLCVLVLFCIGFFGADALKVNAESLQFAILGDWGGTNLAPYTTKQQLQVASLLGKLAEAGGVQFVLAVGDNFYFFGVKNKNDSRFENTFEKVYNANSLKNVPWYVIAGNHDWYGNVSAELAYSNGNSRWNFPSHFYTVTHQFAGNINATFVHIDTIVLCGLALADKSAGDGYHPMTEVEQALASKYFTWIDQELTAHANAQYLFVVGHYPIYSIAEHGPNACLDNNLQPLLLKHSVSAYIGGHDHNLQHFQIAGSNGAMLNYVLSGAGAYLSDSNAHANNVPQGSNKFFYPTGEWTTLGQGGLVLGNLGAQQGAFTYLSGNGTELWNFNIIPRQTTVL